MLNYRVVIFGIALVFGLVFSIPSFFGTQGPKINLGLDLQGGMYLALEVKTDEAVKTKIKSLASSLKYFCESEDILVDNLKFDDSRLTFELLDKDEAKKIDEFFAKEKGVTVAISSMQYSASYTAEEVTQIKESAVNQAIETIRNRLDQFGLAEPSVTRSGENKIQVELPGIKTQADEQRARELIAKSAHLTLMAVDEERASRVDSMDDAEAAKYNDILLPDAKEPNRKYLLKEIPILEGSNLTDARVAFDQNNQPVISFTLDSKGARIFGDFSGNNVGKRMAIVLDSKIYSAPVIRERIGGGSGQISGGFSVEEAGDVAIALRSGAIPAPVSLLEKRSVGPSLGADSIRASLLALGSGFVLVLGFMVVYYGISGVISNIAVVVNIFLIIAVMALFGATLTLPGMAGIVLTIGMAVDSNVIINERIREGLRGGMSLKKAIHDGYANAMRAILDANITTLLAAIILFAYGTGAIKGFAITISIGILASMLTAILGTHGIYQIYQDRIEKSKNYAFWFGLKG